MLDSSLADQLTDGGMALLRNPMQLVNESPGPANLDSNGVCHDANTAIASARRQPHVGTFGLDFRQMAENFLGALIADRRRQAGYSQADLARLLPGVSRSALNSIEGGTTKTISPVVANELVKILPVSMPELVRAMGFDLPGVRGVAEDITADLANAPEDVLAAVRLVLNGWRVERAAQRRKVG